MVGDKAREIFDKRAKERQKIRKGNQPGATPVTLPELSKGDARDEAGKAVGVKMTSTFCVYCVRSGRHDI
jgi:hypothetical protein